MWIFSTDKKFPEILKSIGISYEVYKGINEGNWIPAYHLAEDTPQEKIDELKKYQGSRE